MFFKRFRSPSVREQILNKQSTRRSGSKTMLITVAMVLVSIVLIFVLFHVYANNMENNIRSSLIHSVEQRKINIDFRLRSLRQMDENLITLIYPYMDSGAARSEQLKEYEELNSILSLYDGSEYVSNIRIYVPDEKIYSGQGGTFYPLSDLLEQEDAAELPYLQRGGAVWLETHQIMVIDQLSTRFVPSNVLTYAHSMRKRDDYNSLTCVLMLDVEVSQLGELLSAEEEDQYGYLVNDQGSCLAAMDETLLQQQVIASRVMEKIRESEFGTVEAEGRLYVYYRLEYNDWYIIMDYPSSVLAITNSTQSSFLQIMVLVVMTIALTMVFILAYNFTMNVTISRINASLDAMNRGNDEMPEEVPQFLDPLHHLERNTDQMVMTVKELMEDRYKDQIAIAESQMKSLQAQIKPHFLYNTLDIIKWMILDQKNEEAVWMVNSLSKYLRQSINKGPSIIPLREELELSRTYLVIMQKRFENRFEMNFEIEDAAENYMIPKLSLQPLLENALLHGVLYSEKPDKELTVRAWVAEGYLHIEVEDNGNGMSEEKCRALESGEAGYGFANVKKRLHLFSKGTSELQLFSREGMGTCVTIRIPAVNTKEA